MGQLLARCLVLIVVISVTGCTATEKVKMAETVPPLPADCQPVVYRPGDATPTNFKVLGQVSYGDSGFSVSCGRETVTERLRQQACKAGANGIRIKEEKGMDLWSSCYRVDAELLSLGGP